MPTDSTAQRAHRTQTDPSASHYRTTTQRPTHKSYRDPEWHTRTFHPRGPTPSTGPHNPARHSDYDDKCLGTGRVPGRPGLARPPAPQDPNPPGRRHPKTPSTNTPDPPSASPQDQSVELRTTRTARNSAPTPELAGTRLPQSPKHCNPVAPGYQARAPRPKSQHPETRLHQHRASPGQRTKRLQTRSSF